MSNISAEEFYRGSLDGIVIDVRSPGEFAAGHIPHAVNIPLFDDEQRAAVGTTYKESGRGAAVELGLEFVGSKMAGFVRQAKQLSHREAVPEHSPVWIHCWRGGMRSQAFAWLLETAGIETRVLDGGYKAFRKLVHRKIGFRHHMFVLSGLTGAGKTVFLNQMQDAGEQIIDLEKLANHRGSSFGAIGLGAQPSTEQFENRLFAALDAMDPNRRFWVEDEGSRLGHVVVPPRFVKQVRRSPAVFLDVSKETRLDNLMEEYGELDQDGLIEATRGIEKRLGGKNMIDAINAISSGDLRKAADITLSYYDRSYLKAKSGLPRETTVNLVNEGHDGESLVAAIIDAANGIERVSLASS